MKDKIFLASCSILAMGSFAMREQSVPLEAMQDGRWVTYLQVQDGNGNMGLKPLQTTSGALLYKILSPENTSMSSYDLQAVKRAYEIAAAKDKNGRATIMLPYWKNWDFSNSNNFGGNGFDLCQNRPTKKLEKGEFPYYIYGAFGKNATISNRDVRCLQLGGDRVRYFQETLANLVNQACSEFAKQIQWELFSKDQNGKYRFIGDLPEKAGYGVNRPSGEDACVFYPDTDFVKGKINDFGVDKIIEDILLSRSNEANVIEIGSSKALSYWRKKLEGNALTVGDVGYNDAIVDLVRQRRLFYAEDTGDFGNDVQNPLVLMQNGAVQLITFNHYGGQFNQQEGSTVHGQIVDPYFGFTWDYISRVGQDCTIDFEYDIQIFLNYALIKRPDCEDSRQMGLKKFTGIWGYNLACCNSSACDITDANLNYQPNTQPFNQECTNSPEICEPTQACSVFLKAMEDVDGTLTFIAQAIPALGGTITNYQFKQDGVQVQTGASNTLVLDAGDYAEGDIIQVVVTGSLGCTATATHTIATTLPRFRVTANTVVQTNGGSYAAADVTSGGADGSVEVVVENIGGAVLTITSNVRVESAAGVSTYSVPTYPVSINTGDTDSAILTLESSAAIGNYTAVITIESNDADTPTFQFTVTWNVKA